MFFPINTDAPLYHRPIGTVGLIAANCITFAITKGGYAPEGWILTFGQGLHPLEWLSSAFLHFGFLHLIGNMVFLWSYGLIIEGKIGTLPFAGLYFALCLIDGFTTQTLMLGAEPVGGAGGASGVIFALMSIALVWAPLNNFDVVWFFWFGFIARAGCTEASVIVLSCFYLGLNLLWATVWGFSMSSELLHLIGAAIGLPIGMAFILLKGVDCENWDIISVWQGKHLRPLGDRGTGTNVVQTPAVMFSDLNRRKRIPSRVLEKKLHDLIDRHAYEGAYNVYKELHESRGVRHRLDLDRLQQLIEGLRRLQLYKEAATLLERDLLPRHLEDDILPRLILAGLCVKQLTRPKAALRALEPLSDAEMSDADRDLYQKIKRAADSMIEEGVVELALD